MLSNLIQILSASYSLSDQIMNRKSAVETFEIYLKSEMSLVSFLPTTLFTAARDLHRKRVPIDLYSVVVKVG